MTLVQQSAWVVPLSLLFIVAWNRFNSPPTNRSGTTFALFSFGVIFYYALIIAIWLLVIIGLRTGGIGLGLVFGKLNLVLNPQAQEQFAQFAPIFAALIIVVASQFRGISQIDTAARSFCVNLAAIPREADRLAVELSQSADFQPSAKLRDHLTKLISQNIGPQALNFSRGGALPARFTRAVALYALFIGPRNHGEFLFPTNSHSRAVYARIMHLGDDVAARTDRLYEELMRWTEPACWSASADASVAGRC